VIRPLRRRHLRMIGALAIATPIGFAAGLWARLDRAPARPLPGAVAAGSLALGRTFLDEEGLWGGTAIRTRIGESSAPGEAAAVVLELTPAADLRAPDLLVYWSASEAAGTGLPDDALLLGPLAATGPARFVLPAAARGGGRLIVYSLAHGRLVAAAGLPPSGPVER